jgi:hypothetical protein
VQIINGTGVLLNFGGQAIKNVAGYDVSNGESNAFNSFI